ncbi:hypothetical protein PtB15_13B227 [Puccinia triticina]|nr:hypothetical protein PtB15_13B227 [Puccinia triticina]
MTSRLLRVLSQGKENRVQSVSALKVLFKKLLTYVYELHQTVLNKSGMTAPAQRLQHQRLFKWLLKEIFEPDHNILPVMGRIQQPYPDWKGDQTFERLGATQIGLIDYFSGKGEHEEAAEEAANLVKIYQEQHQGLLSAGLQPRPAPQPPDSASLRTAGLRSRGSTATSGFSTADPDIPLPPLALHTLMAAPLPALHASPEPEPEPEPPRLARPARLSDENLQRQSSAGLKERVRKSIKMRDTERWARQTSDQHAVPSSPSPDSLPRPKISLQPVPAFRPVPVAAEPPGEPSEHASVNDWHSENNTAALHRAVLQLSPVDVQAVGHTPSTADFAAFPRPASASVPPGTLVGPLSPSAHSPAQIHEIPLTPPPHPQPPSDADPLVRARLHLQEALSATPQARSASASPAASPMSAAPTKSNDSLSSEGDPTQISINPPTSSHSPSRLVDSTSPGHAVGQHPLPRDEHASSGPPPPPSAAQPPPRPPPAAAASSQPHQASTPRPSAPEPIHPSPLPLTSRRQVSALTVRTTAGPAKSAPPLSVPASARRPGPTDVLHRLEMEEWRSQTGVDDRLALVLPARTAATASDPAAGEERRGIKDRWGNSWGLESHVLSPLSERTERSLTTVGSLVSLSTKKSTHSLDSTSNSLAQRLEQADTATNARMVLSKLGPSAAPMTRSVSSPLASSPLVREFLGAKDPQPHLLLEEKRKRREERRKRKEEFLEKKQLILQRLAEDGENAHLVRDLGLLYLRANVGVAGIKLAIRHLETSLQMDEGDALAWSSLGQAWLALHAVPEAELAKLGPDGRDTTKGQQMHNATIGLRKAIINSRTAEDARTYKLHWARYLEKQGRWRDSLGVLGELIKHEGKHSPACWAALGFVGQRLVVDAAFVRAVALIDDQILALSASPGKGKAPVVGPHHQEPDPQEIVVGRMHAYRDHYRRQIGRLGPADGAGEEGEASAPGAGDPSKNVSTKISVGCTLADADLLDQSQAQLAVPAVAATKNDADTLVTEEIRECPSSSVSRRSTPDHAACGVPVCEDPEPTDYADLSGARAEPRYREITGADYADMDTPTTLSRAAGGPLSEPFDIRTLAAQPGFPREPRPLAPFSGSAASDTGPDIVVQYDDLDTTNDYSESRASDPFRPSSALAIHHHHHQLLPFPSHTPPGFARPELAHGSPDPPTPGPHIPLPSNGDEHGEEVGDREEEEAGPAPPPASDHTPPVHPDDGHPHPPPREARHSHSGSLASKRSLGRLEAGSSSTHAPSGSLERAHTLASAPDRAGAQDCPGCSSRPRTQSSRHDSSHQAHLGPLLDRQPTALDKQKVLAFLEMESEYHARVGRLRRKLVRIEEEREEKRRQMFSALGVGGPEGAGSPPEMSGPCSEAEAERCGREDGGRREKAAAGARQRHSASLCSASPAVPSIHRRSHPLARPASPAGRPRTFSLDQPFSHPRRPGRASPASSSPVAPLDTSFDSFSAAAGTLADGQANIALQGIAAILKLASSAAAPPQGLPSGPSPAPPGLPHRAPLPAARAWPLGGSCPSASCACICFACFYVDRPAHA